jgi:hypothetical protein
VLVGAGLNQFFIRWTSSKSAVDAIYAANDRGYNVKAVVVVIRLNENSQPILGRMNPHYASGYHCWNHMIVLLDSDVLCTCRYISELSRLNAN